MKAAAFRREIILATAGVGLLLATPAVAVGPDQYPDRLIKIVVPFPARGTPDTMARIIADRLQSRWGKPVVVENRPGATGNIGAEAVAKAAPDGYTLLVAPPPPLVINQHLFANLRFDPSEFVPITVITEAPNVLVARPGLPVGSVPELIALARSLWHGGSPGADLMRANIQQLRKEILATARVSEAQIEHDLAQLGRDEFAFPSPILWAAWGRRSP